MSKLFGTDSAKGNTVADLTCEIAMQAGRASAAVLSCGEGKKSKILIGKDANCPLIYLKPLYVPVYVQPALMRRDSVPYLHRLLRGSQRYSMQTLV